MYLLFKVKKGEITSLSDNLNISYIDSFTSYKKAYDFVKSDHNLINTVKEDEKMEFIILPQKSLLFVKPGKRTNKIINLQQISNQASK